MAGNKIWSSIKSEVEFLNKYPTLLQTTSDNEAPIPGYLFGEINAITYKNEGVYCKQLVEYFISKAEGNSSAVKFKAMKMLLYLAKNGHKAILEEAKFHEMQLKEFAGTCQSFQDSQQQSYHADIRKMANEILIIAFSGNDSIERSSETSYKGIDTPTGYGSQATTHKLTGFGNVSNAPRSMGERVTEGFTSLVDKILSPTNENEFYKKQAVVLNESLPCYKPVTIEKSNLADTFLEEQSPHESSTYSMKSNDTFKTKKPVHVAGRAGGGWEDSDEDVEPEVAIPFEHSIEEFSVSGESLDNKNELPTSLEYVDELRVVEEFCTDEPLEKLKYGDISLLCKRCSSLNCDKILEFLVEKMTSDKETIQLRCLIFIEYLLHHDIVNSDAIFKIVVPTLKCFASSEKSPVQIKSKKIFLITESLIKAEKSPKTSKTQLQQGKCKS